MKLPKTKTTLLWKTAVRELSTPDPETVVWLWQMADRVYHAPGRRLLFARAPVLLGPVTLYPITLQGIDWLINVSAWWQGGDLLPAAYACAHSDGRSDAFDVMDRADVELRVRSWANRLPCTPDDLRAAVQIQTSTPDATVDTRPGATVDTSATDWGELLAMLSGAYHIAPWDLIGRPFVDIEEMLDKMPRVAAIYGRAADDPDRRKALREFQEAVLYVKKGGV